MSAESLGLDFYSNLQRDGNQRGSSPEEIYRRASEVSDDPLEVLARANSDKQIREGTPTSDVPGQSEATSRSNQEYAEGLGIDLTDFS